MFINTIWKLQRSKIVELISFIKDITDIILNNKNLNKAHAEIGISSIIIIADKFLPRVDKITSGLLSLNKYKIILLTKKKNYALYKHYDKIIYFYGSYKVKWILKYTHPFVIHIFSSWNFDIAYSLIKVKIKIKSKFIFDDYDVLAGMTNEKFVKSYLPTQLEKEKYCLENAEGLCCRSLETQFAKKYLNYQYIGQRIFFPEYMREKINDKTQKNPVKSKTIVYAGNVNIELLIKVSKVINKIGWNIDVYPFQTKKSYKNIRQPNLKFYDPLPNKELIEKIKQYNLALQVPIDIENLVDQDIYTDHKKVYAMSGKMFDYIEANNKVIISELVLIRWILNRYGFAINIEPENYLKELCDILVNYNHTNQYCNLTNRLTIKNQIKRLEKFYKNL